MTSTILIDARNIDQHYIMLANAIANAPFTALDVETEDSRRHAGLNKLCGYNEDGFKSKGKKLVFDHRRTTLCGISFYNEQMPAAVYLNVGHADVENRLPHDVVRSLLETKPESSYWLAHNAPFEIITLRNTLGFDVTPKIICTLQMAVSTYGPQEFPRTKWEMVGQGGIAKLMPALMAMAEKGLTDPDKMTMSPELSELVYKIIAKESDAEWSYNGLADSIAYGYGLKKAVLSHFGHQMSSFADTLGENAHMGQLTGEQVAEYGADDSFWAFRLFHKLLGMMPQSAIECFFNQENPMTAVFSDIARGGMKVNTQAIISRRDVERHEMAVVLRTLKSTVMEMLPFSSTLHEGLLKHDSWYQKNADKYRQQVLAWANSGDSGDDFEQCAQVRGPVSNAWASDLGRPEPTGLNTSHYMVIRTLIYDLTRTKLIVSQGKTQSDGEARGKLKDRFEKERDELGSKLIDGLNKISGIEQRIKLYLTNYMNLVDPETSRMYPTVTSMLATRRMAASNPNPMQLAKRGESTYVRGFFEADDDDHVMISCDWSGIELVEIAEFSGDPEFIKCFAQLPHDDLHSGAAADILAVDCPGLDETSFKALKRFERYEDYAAHYGSSIDNIERLFTNLKGEPMTPPKAMKFWRTEVGKGSNFNYFYSGYLATVGERMGWSSEKTLMATQRYAQRFSVAESWRLGIIEEVARNGFVTLPDGQRYNRFEATPQFQSDWHAKFSFYGASAAYEKIIYWLGRKLAKRAGNQTVNAYIQGTCATIAKRSILRIIEAAKARGWTEREFRFLIPVHDELVFSAHRGIAVEAMHLIRNTMIDHPDLFTKCKLDASPSIGLTFEPWDAKKARTGQVEIYEPPEEIVGKDRADKRADDGTTQEIINWLFTERGRLTA
jgi:DNA polymerase I-like protein with 3'-5' exonuclease and polymerase domains